MHSWATPLGATPARPVAACRAKYGRIRSILRSSLMNRTTGILLSAAKLRTARRNAVPIRSRSPATRSVYPNAGSESSPPNLPPANSAHNRSDRSDPDTHRAPHARRAHRLPSLQPNRRASPPPPRLEAKPHWWKCRDYQRARGGRVHRVVASLGRRVPTVYHGIPERPAWSIRPRPRSCF